jgi:hypothetical protein
MRLTRIMLGTMLLCIALSALGCGTMVGPTTATAAGPQLPPTTTATVAHDSFPTGEHAMACFAQQAMGPGGGWLVGSTRDNLARNRCDLAAKASRNAEEHPAEPADVAKSDTADLNHDGFVTLDEILAMRRVLTPEQMVERIRKVDGIFCLTRTQQQYLLNRGVSVVVIDALTQCKPTVAKASPAN